MPTKTLTKAEFYTELLDFFNDEQRGWCQGQMLDGQSACLVGGVRAVAGAAYAKSNGKVFISRDPKRWSVANEVLTDLHTIQFPDRDDHDRTTERLVIGDYRVDMYAELRVPMAIRAQNDLMDFNDTDHYTRAEKERLRALDDRVTAELGYGKSDDDLTEEQLEAWYDRLNVLSQPIHAKAQARAKKRVLNLIEKARRRAEKAGV